jgi:uncharacterized damage-inducible protein DinB
MKSFFQEMFDYHHYFNKKLMEEFEKHSKDLPERCYPLFCHILNAHQIWNARILGNDPGVAVWDVNPLDLNTARIKENYDTTVKILNTLPFDKNITYKTFKGDGYINTIQDILFHVSNHSTHHRGQIISDFRQSGIEPIVTDYIFYKR